MNRRLYAVYGSDDDELLCVGDVYEVAKYTGTTVTNVQSLTNKLKNYNKKPKIKKPRKYFIYSYKIEKGDY